jgi:hypothetical protein
MMGLKKNLSDTDLVGGSISVIIRHIPERVAVNKFIY